jgi:membrane protease subunit HflC
MRRFTTLIIGIVIVVLGILATTMLFTVHQTKQVIVLQFGNPIRVVKDPGLGWKWPWQSLEYYEQRVLNLDPPVERIILADQKPLLVDSYARYTIEDPLRFFQTVRSESELRVRLGTIVNSQLRSVLGNQNLASVLSEERAEIMRLIKDSVNEQAQRFGISLVDVRIRRADLPQQTSESVYDRMRSERIREAKEFRAQGFEQAQRIKAGADREATVIRAEAEREADILRGQGEGERTRILNVAYGQDADFFNFYRSMQAYERSLRKGTYMVLSPDSEFFSFFGTAATPGTVQPSAPGGANADDAGVQGQTDSEAQGQSGAGQAVGSNAAETD